MNKWIIFGCSPFINNINNFSFAKNYNTIAVNRFNKYINDYRCAFDVDTIQWISDNNCKEKLILSTKSYNYLQGWHVLHKKQRFELNTHYLFKTTTRIVEKENGKLFGHRSSAIPAINYAILQGAKEIYLIGIDFNWNKGHYYNSTKGYKSTEDLEKLRQNIKQYLNYVDIYRCNPDKSLLLSFLRYKDIKEL